jgi:hypothetical protein
MLRRPALLAAVLTAFGLAGGARADDQIPIVHPIYVHLPDAPEEDALRRSLTAAATRYKLHPVEVVDIPPPPAPRAPELLKTGVASTQKIAFADALRDLDAAAAEVAATGGNGLSTEQLADLYLNRAIATAQADWNATAAAPPTAARTRAYADYVRAATLAPGRALNAREIPPQAVADFGRAVADVRQRPRGTLTVTGSADALVSLDGAAPIPVAGGVTFRDVVNGEHLIRVEEIGYAGWGAVVTLNQPAQEVAIPARTALGLDAATAAAHARRMGARFALVLEPKGGPRAAVALRLIDASGQERDAVVVTPGNEAGTIDSAVMRLDETARRLAHAGAPSGASVAQPGSELAPPVLVGQPPPPRARLFDDPGAWARDHWPLLTAVGVVVVSSIILGAAVSADH